MPNPKNFSLIWRRRWRAAKFRLKLGAQGLWVWAGMDLYRATPAVTQGLRFSGLIRKTAQFNRLVRLPRACGGPIHSNTDPPGSPLNRLLRLARVCSGPILTQILTGQESKINPSEYYKLVPLSKTPFAHCQNVVRERSCWKRIRLWYKWQLEHYSAISGEKGVMFGLY
jgi:hypothetical protein